MQSAGNYSMLGKIVKVTVDRPLDSVHPKHKDIIYNVNLLRVWYRLLC